ncbi:hypothetical protein KDJ21_002730 [Metabacillus litoralis]|uniref:hypothetical protein n=1 Tax=Metabacillus litoralis TaxID=152268 RepID=UPI001E46AFA5|nr:hypothetical protein [Metabacillus litoralis]UHA60666.1 hypothetical protein KDJ21_002730 [Metabacillus litoralis]
MNPYLVQLLKLNILSLAVYITDIAIEELLLIKWKDVKFQQDSVILKISEQNIKIKDGYFNLFLKELSEQCSNEN